MSRANLDDPLEKTIKANNSKTFSRKISI